MSIPVKKIVIAAVAAVSLSSAFSSPAAAWCNGWGCGGGDGGAVAAGVLGGLALGAVAASAAQPRYYYVEPAYGGGCWIERRPVYDEWGNYIGRRRIRVCQ